MNQQIKTLLEAAGFVYIKDDGIGWAGNHNTSLPKLVEEVVKNCAEQLIKQAKFGYDDYSEEYALLMREAKYMKSRFGVEE